MLCMDRLFYSYAITRDSFLNMKDNHLTISLSLVTFFVEKPCTYTVKAGWSRKIYWLEIYTGPIQFTIPSTHSNQDQFRHFRKQKPSRKQGKFMQANGEGSDCKNVSLCLVGFLILYKPYYWSSDENGTKSLNAQHNKMSNKKLHG